MIISLIVAISENNVIGNQGKLPWHLPADLNYFKTITMGKPIIMGRHTFESIGKPLPSRTNIVVTRQLNYRAEGITVAHSLQEALESQASEQEVFLIGGAQLYQQALPIANRFYLTEVHASFEGDTYFPPWDRNAWKLIKTESHSADEKNSCAYTFKVLQNL